MPMKITRGPASGKARYFTFQAQCISALRYRRDQSKPSTASQKTRLGWRTNSTTEVNNVEFSEAEITISATEKRDLALQYAFRKNALKGDTERRRRKAKHVWQFQRW
jgi:hypothetical protein